MKNREMAIKIVNLINDNYSIELKTVEMSQMTDEILCLLNEHFVENLKELVEDLKEVHSEYIIESINDKIDIYENGI